VYPRVTAHNTRLLWARDHAGPARFGAGAMASRLSRYGGRAGPDGSTTLHPESLRPSRDAATPTRSGDRATFFSCVVRIRTRDPVLRPFPVGPQALQRPADGFITHTPRGHPLLVAHLGGQGKRPDTRGLAIGARRLMQDMLETLTRGGVQGRLDALGPRRLLRNACQASRIKGMDDVADGLYTTPHQLRNRLRRQPAATRQHHLGTTQTEGIGGVPSRF
jgi:hypothetical protein